MTTNPHLIAELRALIAELEQDRVLPGGTWTASKLDAKSVLPPEGVKRYVVEDQLRTPSGAALIRGSVGVFGDERHARFTALAHQALPALLAELETYEALSPQQCPRGIHADWLIDSERTHACPWCRIAELQHKSKSSQRCTTCSHTGWFHCAPEPHSCFTPDDNGQSCTCKSFQPSCQWPTADCTCGLQGGERHV